MMAHIFNITIGQTFSGGFIDFILFGVLQGNAKTNWVMVPVIGSVWFALYYFSFTFIIKRKNLKTPGREDDDSAIIENIAGSERTEKIIEGLGGRNNIKDIDCCATRLRISVINNESVNETLLKATGARAVIIKGNGIQVVYGPQVTIIKTEIEEAIGC
jgi:PTS system maltose and glucose-specific IIC component